MKYIFCFNVTARVSTGGTISVKDFELHGETRIDQITANINFYTLEFIYDFYPPVHCSTQTPKCDKPLIDIGPPATKRPRLEIKWDGWFDNSDIEEYEYEVYKMQPYGNKLGYADKDLVKKSVHSADYPYFPVIILKQPGAYCIQILVKAYDGRYTRARRFMIFDNQSQVTINPSSGKINVLSATSTISPNTYWQRDTSKVKLNFHNRFINRDHLSHKYLIAIKPSNLKFDKGYEELKGQPPLTRSMEAVNNVNGIVEYEIGYNKDRKMGTTVKEPLKWVSVGLQEEPELPIESTDGDAVKVWVRGKDIVGNTKEDSVVIFMDATGPEISEFSFRKGSDDTIAIHGSSDLHGITFEFTAFDPGSGLTELGWELIDIFHQRQRLGGSPLPVKKVDSRNCPKGQCACVEIINECYILHNEVTIDAGKLTVSAGAHDFDYHIVITATNHAGLKTEESFKFTIDTTPPEPGIVLDAAPDGSEIDFQQGFTLQASWDGFIDRESGILFYRYMVLERCATRNDFLASNEESYKTNNRFASYNVTQTGKYFFSVVAYNKVRSPSEPACSDGVVIDTTPAEVKHVMIETASVKPGIIKHDDHFWFVNKNHLKVPIPDSLENCRHNALEVEEVEMIPDGEPRNLTEKDCAIMEASSATIYLPSNHELSLEWEGQDLESGIYDYEIGLSSSSNSEVPDIKEYTSTSSHTRYTSHHLNLAGGQTFFIYLKATNRAQIPIVKVIGPVIVDVTPPVIEPDFKLTVRHKEIHGDNFLLVTWPDEKISDPESGSALTYEFAIGSTPGGVDILNFDPIDKHLQLYCKNRKLSSCLAYSIDHLDWTLHDHRDYYISLSVINVAGLSTVVSSDAYYHYILIPSAGHVFEISQKTYSDVSSVSSLDDIDFQSDNRNIWVHWSGFAHPHELLTFRVGLGSAPSKDDIVGFQPVSTTHHHFSRLNLQPFKKYYVTVEARNRVGPASSSSDGIMILPANPVDFDAKVFDGPPCQDAASQPCEEDIDFHSSTSVVDAHWKISEKVKEYFTHIKWGIQRREESVNDWLTIMDYQDVHDSCYGHIAGLTLRNNDNLRIAVKFCHPDGCYRPVYSNGFWVITEPPTPEPLVVLNVKRKVLSAIWTEWSQSGITAANAFSHYEWQALSSSGGLLLPWKHITNQEMKSIDFFATAKKLKTADLPDKKEVEWKTPFKIRGCVKIGIRGFNNVGLYSTVYRLLPQCYQAVEESRFIIDAIGTWSEKDKTLSKISFDVNNYEPHPDVDYTPSDNMLSALWPHLRHTHFDWKIISDKAIRDWKQTAVSPNKPLKWDDYSNTAPEVLKHGSTQDRYINVEDLHLQHGQRYYVCVYAHPSRLSYESGEEILEAVKNCSDGVVVDLTPPTPGKIEAGFNRKKYQSSTTEFFISWNSFVDVEELGFATHTSGIKSYYYGLGSFPGKTDVIKFTSAGHSNLIHIQGLELQSGQKYYGSIKAVDFAGHETIAFSTGIVVDTSPPVVTDSKIDIAGLGGSNYQTIKTITASWYNVFIDPESGISGYEWCVGSVPNYCDIMAFAPTTIPEGDSHTELNFHDGQTYFITVKAYNNAGLGTITSSWGMVVDTSPPVCGIVYDGNLSDEKDVNYKTDVSTLKGHWQGFNDPHSPLLSYFVAIGTCPNCDDFIDFQEIGLRNDISWDGLKLALGKKYYITVKACNAAELCCITSSDGVISDNTPPNSGLVYDGFELEDIEWQHARNFLAAHWINFYDVHSGISHYEWKAGTSKGGDNILPTTKLHIEQRVFTSKLKEEMPLGTRIYITVIAYNKVGLFSERTSDGFKIDASEPELTDPVEFDQHDIGAYFQSFQFWRSSLKIKWKFTDKESDIYKQYISVFTEHNSYLHFPTVEVPGASIEYQFTDLKMNDGDEYFLRVIACNQAKLCKSTTTGKLKIDGSPPKPGVFALATDRAIPLPFAATDWMTYTRGNPNNDGKPRLKIAWLSFSDPHSEVFFYYVGAGKTMYGFEHSKGAYYQSFTTQDPTMKTEDGYYVQTKEFVLDREIVAGEKIYISILAANRLNLHSNPLHGSFTFEYVDGSYMSPLTLVRNCPAQSCMGHCACAGEGHICPNLAQSSCNDVTGKSGYATVTVSDVINMQGTDYLDIDFTPATCTLTARWALKPDERRKLPVHYDVTAGVENEAPWSAFSVTEEVWFDAEILTWHIFTPYKKPGEESFLVPNRKYIIYVRAWYDEYSYAIYKSSGVFSDHSPPEKTQVGRVTEVSRFHTAVDVAVLTNVDQINFSWKNAFKDDQSSISYYNASLSSFPGGQNAMRYMRTYGTEAPLRKLQTLLPGFKYYLNVLAVNRARLTSVILSSKGFIVDKEPPEDGIVLDGIGITDINYQNLTNVLSASWHGFFDLHSYIHHYMWCVGSSPGLEDILPCTDVGLRQHASKYIPDKSISRYYSTVHAVDGGFLLSKGATSDGVTVDSTPPQSLKIFKFGSNLILNPSFEKFSNGVPNHWEVTGQGKKFLSGNSPYFKIKGKVSQKITTQPGHHYCTTLYVSHPTDQKVEVLGQISIPGLQKIFTFQDKKGSSNFVDDEEIEWSPQVFYFVASESASTVSIESVGATNSLLVNKVMVQHMEATDTPKKENTVFANLIISNRYHAVYCHWDMIDPESGINHFEWAIGTAKGGTQLQGFKSVGTSNSAFTDSLKLDHNSDVYVTVMAENKAGLRTVKYSNRLHVDLTPPEIFDVRIGDKNIHFQQSFQITVHWKAVDKESILKKCCLALGTESNYQDIQRFAEIGVTSPVKANIPSSVDHGTEIIATIRCQNSAGLRSLNKSEPIVMMVRPPDSRSAVVLIGISSHTQYPIRGNYQPYPDSLSISWTGFSDIQGIEHYEVRVADARNRDVVAWVSTRSPWITSLKLENLHLIPNEKYYVFVRATNEAGQQSEPKSAVVTIESSPPVSRSGAISSRWNRRNLQISWQGKFSSHSSLVYEVSVGSKPNSNDVLKWTQTTEPQIVVENLKSGQPYHVVITAINEAGLYTTDSAVVR